MLKKKFFANVQRIIELFIQKIVTIFSKILIWDPGSEVRDQEKNIFRIPDLGSRGQKGTGSRIRIRNTDYVSLPYPGSWYKKPKSGFINNCFHSVFCAGKQRVDPQRAGGRGGPHPLRECEDAAVPRGHAHRQRHARPTQGHAEERPPAQGHQSQAQGQFQPISLVGFRRHVPLLRWVNLLICTLLIILCTGASLYAPYSLLLISNKFWMGVGQGGELLEEKRGGRVGGGE